MTRTLPCLVLLAACGDAADDGQAALPAVGVMDMLRFHRFTPGRFRVDDYGSTGKTIAAYADRWGFRVRNLGMRLPEGY